MYLILFDDTQFGFTFGRASHSDETWRQATTAMAATTIAANLQHSTSFFWILVSSFFFSFRRSLHGVI